QDGNSLAIALGGMSACCVIVVVLLIFYIKQKRNYEQSKGQSGVPSPVADDKSRVVQSRNL
ncbi:hypothetical protein CHARACLAT_033470, partial [Characodon lateralis]|nr:hypothetical protein [Characodon lateralis]